MTSSFPIVGRSNVAVVLSPVVRPLVSLSRQVVCSGGEGKGSVGNCLPDVNIWPSSLAVVPSVWLSQRRAGPALYVYLQPRTHVCVCGCVGVCICAKAPRLTKCCLRRVRYARLDSGTLMITKLNALQFFPRLLHLKLYCKSCDTLLKILCLTFKSIIRNIRVE